MNAGFATLGFRNQPTNRAVYTSADRDGGVGTGPLNGILGVGAEIDLTSWVSVIPQIQWPFTGNPIVYGPIVSLMARATLGR